VNLKFPFQRSFSGIKRCDLCPGDIPIMFVGRRNCAKGLRGGLEERGKKSWRACIESDWEP
jgi:hypothetical protein